MLAEWRGRLVLLLAAALFSLPFVADAVLQYGWGIYVYYLQDSYWQFAFATAVLCGPGLGFGWLAFRARARPGARAALLGTAAAGLAYLYGAYRTFRAPAGVGAPYFALSALAVTGLLLAATLRAWRRGARGRGTAPRQG